MSDAPNKSNETPAPSAGPSQANNNNDDDLTDLTSTGPLSNLTRIGIMLALLGVDRITFSDLLIAVKMSKSSLSRSLEILEGSGLVIERRGFAALGGPRTFIHITEAGRTATLAHLETLRRLSAKYLGSAQERSDGKRI